MKTLVLASASPRRKELLEQLGYSFTVKPVDIDETPYEGELPEHYLPRMSTSKAIRASELLLKEGGRVDGAKSYGDKSKHKDSVILASDTSVIAESKILGKPQNRNHFASMMRMLSGDWHTVMTSIAVLPLAQAESYSGVSAGQCIEETVATRVKFKPLSDEEINAYWETCEPQDKAGGYGIQGKGAIFVEAIEGSYSNVVGLPLQQVANLLNTQGIDICKIWLNTSS